MFLITGGAGFIGSHFCEYLKLNNIDFFVIDSFITGKKDNISKNIPLIELDLSVERSSLKLKNIITNNNISTIFHFAAIPNVQLSFQETYLTHQNNITATVNILEAMRDTCANTIVFSSTSAVYDSSNQPLTENSKVCPLTPYALQKYTSEQYIQLYSKAYNINATCLRYFNVYGDRMPITGCYKSVIATFFEQYKRNEPLTITGRGKQTRDFIHVNDIVLSNIIVSRSCKGFCIYNIGYGKSYTVNEIAECFEGVDIQYIEKRHEIEYSECCNSKIVVSTEWAPTIDVRDWIKTKLINN